MCAKGTQECAEEMGVYTSYLRLHLCNYVPYFQVHSLAGNRSGMSCTDAEVTDTLNSHTRLTTTAFESGGQLLHHRLTVIKIPRKCSGRARGAWVQPVMLQDISQMENISVGSRKRQVFEDRDM